MGPTQLACLVSRALEEAGIDESSDLDFVTSAYVKELETALRPLGF